MSVYQFSAVDINGKLQELQHYEGQVMVIVNTASKCGFTPQFKDLEALYEKYKDRGFVVLGFPCNQFNNQEPGDEKTIQNYCELNYGVTFPMYSKVDVNGPNAHPLFQHLRKETKGLLGDSIKWNFTKFLVNKEGTVVQKFAPQADPMSMEKDILALL